MEGKKMLKSIGNIIPLRSAIKEHGADVIRVAMLISAGSYKMLTSRSRR